MNIEIIEGFPQKKKDALSKMHPWMMKHHLFVHFTECGEGEVVSTFVETPEEARELAQELQHAVNKLLHWIEKRSGEEE